MQCILLYSFCNHDSTADMRGSDGFSIVYHIIANKICKVIQPDNPNIISFYLKNDARLYSMLKLEQMSTNTNKKRHFILVIVYVILTGGKNSLTTLGFCTQAR